MELTETDLLKGAVYALEQAGHLLHDAYLLFLRERYASSIVLAVFSKEEMGRFELLLDDWEGVASKRVKVTTDSVLSQL
jgi:AbiV family abortive infection protein